MAKPIACGTRCRCHHARGCRSLRQHAGAHAPGSGSQRLRHPPQRGRARVLRLLAKQQGRLADHLRQQARRRQDHAERPVARTLQGGTGQLPEPAALLAGVGRHGHVLHGGDLGAVRRGAHLGRAAAPAAPEERPAGRAPGAQSQALLDGRAQRARPVQPAVPPDLCDDRASAVPERGADDGVQQRGTQRQAVRCRAARHHGGRYGGRRQSFGIDVVGRGTAGPRT